MSGKITLTDEEKEVVKEIYPYILDGDYQNVMSRISYYICKSDQMFDGDLTFDILSFFKSNNIDLWHNISEINRWQFTDCQKLEEITIPSNIISIGNFAFCGCGWLTYVEIDVGVSKFGKAIFSGCETLDEIKYNGTIEQWNNIHKDEEWNDSSSIKTIKCTDGNIQVV